MQHSGNTVSLDVLISHRMVERECGRLKAQQRELDAALTDGREQSQSYEERKVLQRRE